MSNYFATLGNGGFYQFDADNQSAARMEVEKRFPDMSFRIRDESNGETVAVVLSNSQPHRFGPLQDDHVAVLDELLELTMTPVEEPESSKTHEGS